SPANPGRAATALAPWGAPSGRGAAARVPRPAERARGGARTDLQRGFVARGAAGRSPPRRIPATISPASAGAASAVRGPHGDARGRFVRHSGTGGWRLSRRLANLPAWRYSPGSGVATA